MSQPAFNPGNAAARNHPARKLQFGSQHVLRPTALVAKSADLAAYKIHLFHATNRKARGQFVQVGFR